MTVSCHMSALHPMVCTALVYRVFTNVKLPELCLYMQALSCTLAKVQM